MKSKKIRKTHTFDSELYEEFTKICDEEAINMSGWLNNQVKKFVKAHQEEQESEDNESTQ